MLTNAFYFIQNLVYIVIAVTIFLGVTKQYAKQSRSKRKPLITLEISLIVLSTILSFYNLNDFGIATFYTCFAIILVTMFNGVMTSIIYYRKLTRLIGR